MSRKVPEETYRKTFSYRFRQWLDGTKDPFLDQVEMKKQKPFAESEEARERREQDSKALEAKGEDFRMLIISDHRTIMKTGAHGAAPVPFILYDSRKSQGSGLTYTEENGLKGPFVEEGVNLMSMLFEL